ncbi:uncharacterized protein LACBIDRAFT_325715 [Laccaria bicolor S238N-H82]|uniref:Predicted protein n=1 Tax=Laccaria bicolor (strain S238N-H82 / ATCC MYA-4686) TaxID=486041 RepID=B0D5Z1_LACBS|nr:uncharacterized protein LACBIDRAFT_325715 [Laccaria bicolor S238N-H82]EDR10108.1 predicted protein [Laccaria bicolor S238N-H82]|eukprot:XP_001879493.1 predicted protein [Laccaria bicolor S238N-H82]
MYSRSPWPVASPAAPLSSGNQSLLVIHGELPLASVLKYLDENCVDETNIVDGDTDVVNGDADVVNGDADVVNGDTDVDGDVDVVGVDTDGGTDVVDDDTNGGTDVVDGGTDTVGGDTDVEVEQSVRRPGREMIARA